MRILLVEDEHKVAEFIREGLQEEYYAVDTATDGENGTFLALTEQYDLIILDIMLPKRDGIQVLREIRHAQINTPVLVLTARSTVADKVEGLDSGADDYLTKPFAFAELIARVRALLRRGREELSTKLRVADLILDTIAHKATRGGQPIELTAKEYALLEYFIRNPNQVLTRTMISEHVWDYHFSTGTNLIDVYVNHLRRKIDDNADEKLIQTIRGVGYVLRRPDSET